MKLSIPQLDLRGTRIFFRADLKVPLSEDEIRNNLRIRAMIPTLEHCLVSGASVVLTGQPLAEARP